MIQYKNLIFGGVFYRTIFRIIIILFLGLIVSCFFAWIHSRILGGEFPDRVSYYLLNKNIWIGTLILYMVLQIFRFLAKVFLLMTFGYVISSSLMSLFISMLTGVPVEKAGHWIYNPWTFIILFMLALAYIKSGKKPIGDKQLMEFTPEGGQTLHFRKFTF